MHTRLGFVLQLHIGSEANLIIHADPVYLRASIDEGKVEAVSVVGGYDRRFAFPDVLEPSTNQGRLS